MISDEELNGILYERLAQDKNLTHKELGKEYGLTKAGVRGRVRRYREKKGLPSPSAQTPTIVGSLNSEPGISGRELWDDAVNRQKRKDERLEWKKKRRVIYEYGPVVTIFMADLHLGNVGTDVRNIDFDIHIINTLAKSGVSVAVVLLGDLLDNFIVGRLRDLHKNENPFLLIEQWGMVSYALEKLAPYLVGSVGGNHDAWSWSTSGVDILRERHLRLTSGIIYDPIELAFVLQVGDYDCRVICRHDWRGHSMFNPTHGMEHGHHTLGRDFDIGVGAHTHRGGLAREFANGKDIPGHALICGTYKKEDSYAKVRGYPPPLSTTAVAAVVDSDGVNFSTSNISSLVKYVPALLTKNGHV